MDITENEDKYIGKPQTRHSSLAPNQTVKSYRDLTVWQKAMDLVELVYEASKEFPREELYGLTNQLRRAAVSIPSNIAEGQARNSTAEFRNFLSIARGSLAEVDTQLLIAVRLGYIKTTDLHKIQAVQTEVNKMTNSLLSKLATNHSPLTTIKAQAVTRSGEA